MNSPSPMTDAVYIRRALRRLRDASSLPLAFGGLVNSDRQVLLSEFEGSNSGAMRGVVLDFGRGLGGRVVALRRPVVVNDYVSSPRISHDYDRFISAEALQAMVAVPVVVRRAVRGVLYGAIRSATPLGDRIVQHAIDAGRDIEQTLAVQDELSRKISLLEADAVARDSASVGPERSMLREVYAELRVLVQRIDDAPLREQFSSVCERLVDQRAHARLPASATVLSPREIDVLSCVALGATNAGIAADLEIGSESVKSYLRSAMHKLRAHSRFEAVLAARRIGALP